MKVAVDSGPLETGHKVRGVGAYTKELISALGKVSKKVKKLKVEAVDFEKVNLIKYDVVHYTFFHPYFLTLPKEKPAKVVVTIHDLIPLIYPEQYQSGIKGKFRFLLQKYFAKNVDAVIAPSETSKKDIVRFLDIPREKINVIPEASKPIFARSRNVEKLEAVKKKFSLPEKFVLYVGDVNYNKNVLGLIKACKKAGLPLVICGKHALDIEDKSMDLVSLKGPRDWARFIFEIPHPEVAHYKELAGEIKDCDVIRTGFIPDEELACIYFLASVYCQPSFYEGFGLPVLEAMASGTPVVVGRTNALVEVAGGAALVADTADTDDIASKLNKVLNDKNLRKDLIAMGKKRVKEFSWKKVAEGTVDVYKTVINKQ